MKIKISLDISDFNTKNYLFKTINNIQIGIFKINNNEFKVYEMTCPHMGGDLCKGKVSNKSIQCSWHGYIYSLESSLLLENPNIEGTRNARISSEYYEHSECLNNNLKLKNIRFEIDKNIITIDI